MTFTQIEYFLALTKSLNMTEAARHLYITQPTLSRQISAMEEDMDVQLFYRTKGRLQLTPAGEQLSVRFENLLEDYRQSVKQARSSC